MSSLVMNPLSRTTQIIKTPKKEVEQKEKHELMIEGPISHEHVVKLFELLQG